jgi:uncharacterized protein (TIGR02271 family)
MANNVIGLFDNENVADQVVSDLKAAGFSSSAIHRYVGGDRGIHDELLREGIPDDEARYYVDGLNQGGALISVHAEEAETDKAVDIMNRYANLGDDTSAEYAAGTAPAYDAAAAGTTTGAAVDTEDRTAYRDDRAATGRVEGEERLEVVEEQLRIGKRQIQRGGVRVRRVVTETPVEEQVTLRDETINVERQRVDRPVSGRADDLFTERTIEVTETDEEAVVAKEARVVEEIAVGKTVEEKTETVRDTVRRADVEVEQLPGGQTSEVYDETGPAYTYGQTLASDKRYTGREWHDIEADARRDWESNYREHGTWEDFKDRVRNSWERARGRR